MTRSGLCVFMAKSSQLLLCDHPEWERPGMQQCLPYVLGDIAGVQYEKTFAAEDDGVHVGQACLAGAELGTGSVAHVERGQLSNKIPGLWPGKQNRAVDGGNVGEEGRRSEVDGPRRRDQRMGRGELPQPGGQGKLDCRTAA